MYLVGIQAHKNSVTIELTRSQKKLGQSSHKKKKKKISAPLNSSPNNNQVWMLGDKCLQGLGFRVLCSGGRVRKENSCKP